MTKKSALTRARCGHRKHAFLDTCFGVTMRIDALVMAIDCRGPEPGRIHRSDQGILYASTAQREILAAHHMIPSVGCKGNCCENAVGQSFFLERKNEPICDQDFRTRVQARGAIFEWIYNRERPHQTLDYLSSGHYEGRKCVA